MTRRVRPPAKQQLRSLAWLALFVRQLFVLVGIARTRGFLAAAAPVAPATLRPDLLILVPVLREASGLPATVDHLRQLRGAEARRIVVVTTDRETIEPAAAGPSTRKVAAALAEQGRCTHLHAPTPVGVKADQLNWAGAALVRAGWASQSTFLICFDADSRPPTHALDAFAAAVTVRPDASVFHASSRFELRRGPPVGSSVQRLVCDAGALRANRFVAGFELPRLLAREAPHAARRAAARVVYAHITGHGLCVRLSYLLAHPLPAGDPLEDMHWSFQLCLRNESMIPVAFLDRSEVPPTVPGQLTQAARWFAGPARALRYLADAPDRRGTSGIALAVSAIGSSLEWLGCAVVPTLVAVEVAIGTRATRRAATAVAVVAAAQLVAVEATLGAPDPLRRRATRVLLAPLGLAVHGVGGAIGAGDAAAGRVRSGKTERV